MKKLLITGFEPFGGESINPSWEIVKALPDVVGDYELTKLCIPVVFGRAAELVLERAGKIHPDVILSIGQAGGRSAITPELLAINLRHASIPDNMGNRPTDEPIIPGGETAYFSTLPVRRIAEAIGASGIASQVSYTMGSYVCNDLTYILLSHFRDGGTQVGFIHVPYCTEQGKEPSMAINTMIDAIKTAIEAI